MYSNNDISGLENKVTKELLVLLAGVVVVLISLGLYNFAILDDVEVDTYAKLEGKK